MHTFAVPSTPDDKQHPTIEKNGQWQGRLPAVAMKAGYISAAPDPTAPKLLATLTDDTTGLVVVKQDTAMPTLNFNSGPVKLDPTRTYTYTVRASKGNSEPFRIVVAPGLFAA